MATSHSAVSRMAPLFKATMSAAGSPPTSPSTSSATRGNGGGGGGRVVVRDQSLIMDERSEMGRVHAVTATYGENRVYRMQICTLRTPICGDKLSARHGQKGVIGGIVAREDLPFGVVRTPVRDLDGNVVGMRESSVNISLLLNPNAIPSRMTIGMLFEMVYGVCAAVGGYIADGTCFQREVTPKTLQDELRRLGLNPSGRMQLRSGETGELLGNASVFVGVAYYQRLKQLAAEKARALHRGKTSALTRQPMEGKKGGLRIGEMERDGLIAHGAAAVVEDSFLHRSDDFVTTACTKCGLLACPPRRADDKLASFREIQDQIGFCFGCDTDEHVTRVRIPFALKLFMQELMSLGIAPRMRIRKSALVDFAHAAAPSVTAEREDGIPTVLDYQVALEEEEEVRAKKENEQGGTTAARPRARRVQAQPGGASERGPDLGAGMGLRLDPLYGE